MDRLNARDFAPVEYDTPYDRPWQAPQQLPYGNVLSNRPGVMPRPSTVSPGGFGPARAEPVSDSHHYARVIEGNLAPGTVGQANTLTPFLTENSVRRNMLGLRNASASGGANIYIGFGSVATTFSWLILAPGDVVLFDEVVPQNDLYATADAASALLSYAVSTIPDTV